MVGFWPGLADQVCYVPERGKAPGIHRLSWEKMPFVQFGFESSSFGSSSPSENGWPRKTHLVRPVFRCLRVGS